MIRPTLFLAMLLATVAAATVVESTAAGARAERAATTGTPTARTSAEGACTDDRGVTVVVDFGPLAGGTLGQVVVRCAGTRPTTGLEALQRAGISYSTTFEFQRTVCRIDDRPADDPCDTVRPGSSRWTYWTAQPGGEWTASDGPAGERTPPPGSVEGWAHGPDGTTAAATPPRVPPPPLPLATPPTTARPRASTTTIPDEPATGDEPGGPLTDDPATAAPVTPGVAPRPPRRSEVRPSTTRPPDATTTTLDTIELRVASGARSETAATGSASAPLFTTLAVGSIVAVAAASAWLGQRRRNG